MQQLILFDLFLEGKISNILVDILLCPLFNKLNFSLGNNGVKCSNGTLSLAIAGSLPFILFTLIKGKYFSPDLGGRTVPIIVSPVFNPNNFICECET